MTDPDKLAAIRARHSTIINNSRARGVVCDYDALLAMLDEANGRIRDRDDISINCDDIDTHATLTRKCLDLARIVKLREQEIDGRDERIAELEGAFLENAGLRIERDALRAALAEAPSYDRIQEDRDVYDDWKDRTRELL